MVAVTIDGFQGKEAKNFIVDTTRCNRMGRIGSIEELCCLYLVGCDHVLDNSAFKKLICGGFFEIEDDFPSGSETAPHLHTVKTY